LSPEVSPLNIAHSYIVVIMSFVITCKLFKYTVYDIILLIKQGELDREVVKQYKEKRRKVEEQIEQVKRMKRKLMNELRRRDRVDGYLDATTA